MELKIFSFRIDIKKKIQNEYFETVQNDVESNVLRITLINGAAPYNLYGLNVNIIFKKSDGTRVMQEVTKTNDVQGQIECVLKSNTIACAGIVEAEIKIMEGIKLLTSAKFEFYVRETLLTDDAVESTNEFPVLMQLINETNELIEEVRQIEEQVPENVVSRINTLETTMLTKFDKANLANNLITTAAGFGLDARQGKVLQDQITAQNNKLNDLNERSGSSFLEIDSGYVGIALNVLATSISDRSSGIIFLTTGGPSYHAVLCKHSNSYYSGNLMSYSDRHQYYFRHTSGFYTIRRLTP